MRQLAISLGRKQFAVRIISAVQRPSRAYVTSVLSRFMLGRFSLSLDKKHEEYLIGFFDDRDMSRIQECPSFDGARVLLSDLER